MRIFYLLIFCALLSAGCNDLKIVSATRATTVSDSLIARVTTAMPEVFEGERLLDTSINPDIIEFENRVSDFDMDSLVFEFSDFIGPETAALENTFLSLLDLDRNDIVEPVFVEFLSLQEYSDSSTPYIIVFDEADSEAIAQQLLEERAAIVKFESTLADRPVEFQLKATLYLKVTGELF